MPEFLTLYNVFLAVSIFSTILYILKLILFIFVGGDTEVHADFDAMTETDVSFNFLSIQSILAFFMGFGWCGLVMLVQCHLSNKVSLLIAFLTGLIFMYCTAYLMFCIKKLNKHVMKDMKELENKTGRTYTAIEPKAKGQIEINFNNTLTIMEAINSTDEKLEAFTNIKVVKVEDNQLFIEKI